MESLSQKNFSIDTQFYPLGSCTMKYNPRACNSLALLPGFTGRHPLGPVSHGQGFLRCMWELQEMLKEVTGMVGVSLTPMAGAQGELAGVAMIRAYHEAHGHPERDEIIVPDAAHGTNPATATMLGCKAVEVPTGPDGDVELEALAKAGGDGPIKRPSDGKEVKSVVFVQNAGQASSEEGHLPYHSGIGDMIAIKQAFYFKEQNGQDCDTTILFDNLRTPGAAGEDFYRAGQQAMVIFSKGHVNEVTSGGNGAKVNFKDLILDEENAVVSFGGGRFVVKSQHDASNSLDDE